MNEQTVWNPRFVCERQTALRGFSLEVEFKPCFEFGGNLWRWWIGVSLWNYGEDDSTDVDNGGG